MSSTRSITSPVHPGGWRRAATGVVAVASTLTAITIGVTGAADRAAATADPAISGVVTDRAIDGTPQITDGEVRAIAEVGNRVVVGGTFTGIGPAIRGAAGVVDLTVARFTPGFPDVVGATLAVAPDGAGGYWVAGNFTTIGGQPQAHLAHVLADRTIDQAFAPSLNGLVRSVTIAGGNLVVAGQFTTVNGSPAASVAAISPTGALVWGGAANAQAFVVAPSTDGTRVFVGGDFTTYAGNAAIKRLVALDAVTGTADPSFVPGTVNLTVRDLAVSGSNLWIGGDFTKVNNITRTRLAVLDATTGALGTTTAAPNGTVRAVALDPTGTTLYLGGDFTRVGTTNVNGFVAVAAASGAITSTPLSLTGSVYDIALDGGANAYVGGNFVITPEKTQPRTLAVVNVNTWQVTSVVDAPSLPLSLARPALDVSSVRALTFTTGGLFVGGDFSDYGTISRPYVAAWDKTTGAVDLGFDPVLDGIVRAVDGSPDGTAVYVGGDFTTVDGVATSRFTKLDIATGGADLGFSVGVDSYVKEIVAHPDGQRVFVGGNFRFTNGTLTERFVGVDAASGAVLPGYQVDFAQPTNLASEGGVRAMSLSGDGTRLAVIGNFRQVEGLDRPLAAVLDVADPAAATVTEWSTPLYTQPCSGGRVGWMRDVTYSPDGTRLYVVTSGHFYYRACDTLNAFDATVNGPTEPVWTSRPGDTIETVAATSDAVYLGGHFRYLDWEHQTDGRFQIGAYDPATGRPLSWNPAANGFRGILVMEAEPGGLYLGGDNTAVGGVPHGRVAKFAWPTTGPTARPWLRRRVDHHIALAAGDSLTVTLQVTNPGTTPLNVTAYTDSISGDVTGQGDCVPTVVGAGASFTCSFPQVFPASPTGTLTINSTTVTADNGTPISLSDRTTIRSLTTYLGADIRTVASPVLVPFPSGDVLWSVTLWNDNELQPMQLDSLTSSLHGDLHGLGTCVTPQAVAPYSMYQCMYTAPVGGQIGTTIANQVVMGYTLNGTPATDVHTTSVRMARPADGGQVLMVVKSTTSISSADVKIRDRFTQLGFTPVLVDDDLAMAADADGKLLVYLSGSTDPVAVGAEFAGVAVPVITALHTLYDEMGLTLAADQGIETVTALNVTTPLHPLVSPLVGAITVVSSARPMNWGVPAAGATVVSSVATVAAGEKPAEFVYQPGTVLADGSTAVACRMAYPAEKTSIAKWTPQMFAWFDRAVRWSVYGCGTGIISTVAGTGAAAATGNGGPATAAAVHDPFGVLDDGAGGFYVVEYAGHRIRQVNAAGVMNAFVGTGTAGSSGDGGPATSALVRNPTRIRRDPQGLLVIVDTGNHKIRRIDANGIITTIAGTGTAGSTGDNGQATSARLNSPHDVAWGPDGSMYIADRNNHRIRKVATTGVITTVAGTGTSGYNGDGIAATTARLFNPYGVAWGPNGLLIADYDNNRVRLIDGAGIIQTVAGTGVPTAAGDGGPAILADLHKPICLFVRPNGGYFVCDYNNNRVRYVDPDGVISTAVGAGTAGFGGDGDLALYALGNRFATAVTTPAGDLLVADRFNRRIRIIIQGA